MTSALGRLGGGAATIQDVARAAGVSASTVSNVINEVATVRPETRERVLQAMDSLDYRVNVAARNLRAGRTGTIGLAVPEIDRPYFGNLAATIIAAAAGHRLNVVIEQTGATRESELRALALSRNRLYDGLILSTVQLGPQDVDLLKVDYPVVILGERIFEGPLDHVAMPNTEGARAATAHLIERGCRRIAILDDDGLGERDDATASTLRRAGFRQALADAGIPHDPRLAVGLREFTMAGGRDAATRLVDSGAEFDGVFCVTDTVAMGALRAFASRGVRVPDEVKVIGFDDVPESEFLVPSLSTVAIDHSFIAENAVGLLVERMKTGGADQPATELVSPYTVIARESTGEEPS